MEERSGLRCARDGRRTARWALSAVAAAAWGGFGGTAARAAPFLNVDFNTSASPNESPDFTAWTGGNNAANQTTPVTKSFVVSSPSVASNSVTVRVAGDASVDASGNLNSTANNVAFNTRAAPTDGGAFTYADLYRDFVYTNNSSLPTFVQLAGLDANTPYQITVYASDPNNAKTTTITNVTGGGSVAFGAVTSNATYASNETYAVTNFATSDATGHVTLRASSTTHSTINGLRVDVPEPTGAGVVVAAAAAGLGGMRRRRRRA